MGIYRRVYQGIKEGDISPFYNAGDHMSTDSYVELIFMFSWGMYADIINSSLNDRNTHTKMQGFQGIFSYSGYCSYFNAHKFVKPEVNP